MADVAAASVATEYLPPDLAKLRVRLAMDTLREVEIDLALAIAAVPNKWEDALAGIILARRLLAPVEGMADAVSEAEAGTKREHPVGSVSSPAAGRLSPAEIAEPPVRHARHRVPRWRDRDF